MAKSSPLSSSLTPTELLTFAMEQTGGPALILDSDLRLVAGTEAALEILGGSVAWGTPAPQVLCGRGDRRPIAEALARGEKTKAEILRPGPDATEIISVRTTPITRDKKIVGHVLYLAPLGEERDGVSETYGILTRSASMRELLRMVERVAQSDASVLVRGETGSGKELVARAIHAASPRKNGPFSAINCAALPEQLLESELFGHERGAFTGAIKDNEGTFRRTNGGTLFLDEVAELPLSVQAKLLRATQEKAVLPVGGSRAIPVDVRIVSATHRSLRNEVAEGRFREDLMYRLRVIPLFLPALRERRADILPLCEHFLKGLNAKSQGRKVEHIAPSASRILERYDFPGNIRQLQNILEYAFWIGTGSLLAETDLPPEVLTPEAEDHAPSATKELADPLMGLEGEARRIARALQQAGGNREHAARSLGVSRSTLWRRMKEFGLDQEETYGRW